MLDRTKLKRLIAAHPWPGYRLAQAAGIMHGTWYNVVNGKQAPDLATLERIAAALGVSAGELLTEGEE